MRASLRASLDGVEEGACQVSEGSSL